MEGEKDFGMLSTQMRRRGGGRRVIFSFYLFVANLFELIFLFFFQAF